MRTVVPGDLIAAAQVLQLVPPDCRKSTADRIVANAHAADQFRKRLGRAHEIWGNGTLAAAVFRMQHATGNPLETKEGTEAALAMVTALSRWRARAALDPAFSLLYGAGSG